MYRVIKIVEKGGEGLQSNQSSGTARGLLIYLYRNTKKNRDFDG